MLPRIAVLLTPLVLTACLRPPALSPEEVLERAALAGQRLDSSAFTVDLDGTYRDPKSNSLIGLTFDAQGIFGGSGREMSADIAVGMHWGEADTTNAIDFRGSVAVVDDTETYVRIDSMEGDAGESVMPITDFSQYVGRWVALPSDNERPAVRLTPDPYLLKAQTAVVTVLKDNGVTRIGDRRMYHYMVAVDRDELRKTAEKAGRSDLESIEATGELWIDADTFYLHKAKWDVSALPMLEGIAQAHIIVALSEHDAAPPVRIPAEAVDADPLTLVFPLREISLLLDAWRSRQATMPSGTLL